VWPGLSGNRIVIALIPGGPSAAGTVLFVTDSGQAYFQAVEAWSSDYLASIYARGARNLAPFQTLRGVETEVLLGAIEASDGVGFAVAAGTAATRWVLEHRDDIAKLNVAVGSIVTVLHDLNRVAPKLFDMMVSIFFKQLVADIPSPAMTDPKAIARFVGRTLIQYDKLTLARNAASLAEALAPVAERAAVTAAKAVPVSAAAARDYTAGFIRDVGARGGVVLTRDEADQILGAVRNAPAEIKQLIDQLRTAVRPNH